MRARLALLTTAITAALLLTGCVGLPGSGSMVESYGDGGSDSAEADELLVDEPDMPAGFDDAGVGVGFRFADNPACDTYFKCVQVEIYAYQDCPSMVYVEGNVLDANDRIIGYTNDTLGSLSEGDTGLTTLTITEDAGESVKLTEINCY